MGEQAKDFMSLLLAVRNALDAYGASLGPRYDFTLTVACPASSSNYKMPHLLDMNQYIDYWNLMAYEYAGSWNTVTSHQANLFFVDAESTPFSTNYDYHIPDFTEKPDYLGDVMKSILNHAR
jgi:chitinase